MSDSITGLHHITAIAASAQRNYDFYTGVMGLRMVKRTVNFDDPGTYHFYYGKEVGMPGTILTFFPWEHADRGQNGTGMATEIGYSVPEGSFVFWLERFKEQKVWHGEPGERFGEKFLRFADPDGLSMTLVVPVTKDERTPWETKEVKKDAATRGFHSVTLSLKRIEGTVDVLTDIFGYRLLTQDWNRYRFVTDAVPNASIVDILEEPDMPWGYNGAGTNHHVAFRVADENVQMAFREKIFNKGLLTPGSRWMSR